MNTVRQHTRVLFPIGGFCIFVILYFIAAAIYPGGSEVNPTADGFSWMHNYWCDLLENTAENGEPTKARSTAIAAMAVLCLSIILFWYFTPALLSTRPWMKKTIRVTGILSMIVLVFLGNKFHDPIINTSVALGLTAMLLCLYGLFRSGMYLLFVLGLLCLLLCLVNTYIYYSKNWIGYLAIIQKISFFLFLLWFCLVLFRLSQKTEPTGKQVS